MSPFPAIRSGSAVIFWDETTLFSGDYLLPGGETILRLPGGSREDYEKIARPFLEALPRGLYHSAGTRGKLYALKGRM